MEDFTVRQLQKISERATEQAASSHTPFIAGAYRQQAYEDLAQAANCLIDVQVELDESEEDLLTIKLSGEEAYILREGTANEVDGVIDNLAKQYKFTEFIAVYLTKTRKEIE